MLPSEPGVGLPALWCSEWLCHVQVAAHCRGGQAVQSSSSCLSVLVGSGACSRWRLCACASSRAWLHGHELCFGPFGTCLVVNTISPLQNSPIFPFCVFMFANMKFGYPCPSVSQGTTFRWFGFYVPAPLPKRQYFCLGGDRSVLLFSSVLEAFII